MSSKVAPKTTPSTSAKVNDAASSKTASLANYAVDKKIGKGQFSQVYRATRLSDKLIVALKKVPVCCTIGLPLARLPK